MAGVPRYSSVALCRRLSTALLLAACLLLSLSCSMPDKASDACRFYYNSDGLKQIPVTRNTPEILLIYRRFWDRMFLTDGVGFEPTVRY